MTQRDIDWSAVRSDYERGASLRALEAKYGISKSAIGKVKHREQWTEWTGPRGQMDVQHTAIVVDPTLEKNLSTKDRQRLFLESYAKHANIRVSARDAGIHRSTVYDWQEHDQDFSFAFNLAKEDAKDVLREEIYKRGKEGWDEEVYQFGLLAGTVHKYSDTLLIFHAKAMMPEYRDKQSIDMTTNASTKDVQAIQDAIARALSNYPEAKIAVAEALAEMEKARG